MSRISSSAHEKQGGEDGEGEEGSTTLLMYTCRAFLRASTKTVDCVMYFSIAFFSGNGGIMIPALNRT